ASGVDMQPLYAEEPRNLTMINAENQYEPRWSFDFIAQFNPVVSTPLDFAVALTVIPPKWTPRFHRNPYPASPSTSRLLAAFSFPQSEHSPWQSPPVVLQASSRACFPRQVRPSISTA